jgi:hypothetical protein
MPTVQQTKARLLSFNPTEFNPTEKRLRWVAAQYPPDVLAMTAATFAEATGQDRISGRLVRYAGEMDAEWGDRRDWRNATGDKDAQEAFDILGDQKDGFTATLHTRFDRYLPWAAREFGRLRDHYKSGWTKRDWDDKLHTQFRAIVDWAEAERVDLNRYDLRDALDAAEAWGEVREAAEIPQGRVVHRFSDGWTVQELNEQDALDAEGRVMQHCLDTYESDRGMDSRCETRGAFHTRRWSSSRSGIGTQERLTSVS